MKPGFDAVCCACMPMYHVRWSKVDGIPLVDQGDFPFKVLYDPAARPSVRAFLVMGRSQPRFGTVFPFVLDPHVEMQSKLPLFRS